MLSKSMESRIFTLFTAAFVLVVGGIGLNYASGRQDVPDGFRYMAWAMMAIGGVVFAYAVLLTATLAFTPNSAHQIESRKCTVIARYLLTANGAMVVNEMPSEDLDQRPMVKLQFEDGDIGDYECDPETYRLAEIHQEALATVQGKAIRGFQLKVKDA